MTKENKEKLLKLVKELRGCDHGFLTVEGALHFSQPFGFKARTYTAHARPNDPKGLTFHDGAKSGVGISAHELAEDICQFIGAPFDRKFGRGSQLRSCCEAIEAWINKD